MTLDIATSGLFDFQSITPEVSEDLDAFRSEVAEFLTLQLSPDLSAKVRGGFQLTKEDLIGWHKILQTRKWAAGLWPEEYGGSGWSVRQNYIFDELCTEFGAPPLQPMGVGMVGPLLISSGSEWQKSRFLSPMVEGDEFWCQGFSEPGSGSDLASVSCAASRCEGGYLVNGSKIWTTYAQWADWMILLARTRRDGPRQAGITILLVDMKAPGIEVRPIISIDGAHVLNQVFFTDVFVPEQCRVGDENAGWAILKQNIGLERIANGAPGFAKAFRRRLMLVATRRGASGQRSVDQAWFRRKIADIDVRLAAFEAVALQAIEHDDLPVRPEASLLKARGTELQQDILRLTTQAAGYAALAFDPDAIRNGWNDEREEAQLAPVIPHYLFMRKASISSGTNEIQRDIIAQHILGRVE